jgi:hypothetical protein
MTLQLHRPDGEGGLEPRPVVDQEWRNQLRSTRWGASLRGGRLPRLKNTEMEPTSVGRSLLPSPVRDRRSRVVVAPGA